MTGERPLFPASELVSDETRRRWRERLKKLDAHRELLDEYELKFLDDWIARMKDGQDMNLQQSSFLNRTFHRVEEAVG